MQHNSIFAAALTLLIISGMSVAFTPPAAAVGYVPISIVNTQSVATSANFQQMVVVNAAKYSSYVAKSLSNVEFTYSDGKIVPSWLESTGSNAVYWLNLKAGIAANSNIMVYMVLMPKYRNLFNKYKGICEAPGLSSTYAKYDCGAKIFNFYDNFAGISISNVWHSNSCTGYSAGNELIITHPGSTAVGNCDLNTPYSSAQNSVFDASASNLTNAAVASLGFNNGVWTGVDFQKGYIGDVGYKTAIEIRPSGTLLCTGAGTKGSAVLSLEWYGSTLNYLSNYNQLCSVTNSTYTSFNTTGFYSRNQGTIYIHWTRIRDAPPNGVMPSAAFGNVV